jgi:multidrug efflux pump subunit AcrA (membrane-fusion protein)
LQWDGFWRWYDRGVNHSSKQNLFVLAKADKPAAKDIKPGSKTAAKNGKLASKTEKTGAKGNKAAAKSAEGPAAATFYTVKKRPLRVTVELDGVFAAKTAREILVKPEEWTTLTVESAVAHGAVVREGDVLLRLETEKLDHAIADLRHDVTIAQIGLRQSEGQLEAMEKLTPLDLETNQRMAGMAQEDQKYFLDVFRSFMLKAADFSLKMAREHLEYEEEELHQLEKMYKANDITEETEQIVLKRARDAVERAKFMVEYATLGRNEITKIALPRMGEQMKDAARRKTLDAEKNKIELPLMLEKQRLETKKLRLQWERTDERLRKMLADRELLTVKSPIDGTVYYGKCVKGKFSDSASLAENLRRNGTIAAGQVVMTVVQPRPMFIEATATEEQLGRLRPGLQGTATPTGYPDLRLSAAVDRVAELPTAPGSFDTRLSVRLDRQAKWLMPGMTCKVKLIAYQKKDALSVPLSAVTTDEWDEQQHFVYVQPKEGKPRKQAVILGQKTEKQVEILKGLAEGDRILAEAPKDEN